MSDKNNSKAIINILGSCISRDIFSHQKNDGNYQISKYSNEFDVFSVTEKPLEIDKEKYYKCDLSDVMSNYLKRCLYLDMTKNTLNYIKEEKSDYLIIDSAICRFSSYLIGDTHIAATPKRRKALSLLYDNNVINVSIENEIMHTKEMMAEQLKCFADEILKIYAPEEIILIDIQCSFFHDNGTQLEPFKTPNKWVDQNNIMRFGFDVLKEAFYGCHIIPMPDAVVSDTNHWLKLSVLHYTKEYYYYAYNCIEIINQKLPIDDENDYIDKLWHSCSEFYTKKYFNQLAIEFSKRTTLLYSEQKSSLSRDIQAKFFRELLYKHEGIVDFLEKHKHKSIVIYGWTRVSEYYVEALDKTDIKIVCIMENMKWKKIGKKCYNVIKRASDIPEADCIIIADLLNKEKIVDFLHKKTSLPVYTDDDILKILK